MKLVKTQISIGLEKPLHFLHITDNHLTFADERDDERKITLAENRHRAFEGDSQRCSEYLDEMIDYARNHCDLLLHTGDLIDFVSYKNLEYGKQKLDSVDYFMAAGNHEFSLYVGEAFEDEPYKQQSYARVQAMVKNDLTFASRVIGGLNLVAVDNVYYYFNEKQLELLKAEVAKGLPIILMMHNPIHTEALYTEMMVNRKRECAYLCGTPNDMMKSYSEYRYRQQYTTEVTAEFISYVKSQPLVKALLTGHLHFNQEGLLFGETMQYVTGGGFHGDARLVEVL